MTRTPHVDEGLDALVQSVLDGTADEPTRLALEARLAEDEDLRAHYEKMRRTFEALETLEPVEAPLEIRETIRREIAAVTEESPEPRRHRPRRGRSWSPRWLGARQLMSAGAAAAAVALLAVMIPWGEDPGGPSSEDSVGTLLPLDAPIRVTDRFSWSESWGQVDATLAARDGRFDLRVELRAAQDAIVTIEFDASAWEIVGLNHERPLPTEPRTIPGRFELSTGAQNAVVVGIAPKAESGAEPAFRVRMSTLDGSRTGRLTGAPTEEVERDTNFRN